MANPFADLPRKPPAATGTTNNPFGDLPIVPVKPQTGVPEGFEIPNTEPQVKPGDDAFYGAMAGLARGTLGIPGMAADTLGLGMQAGRGIDWLWQKYAQGREKPVVPSGAEVAALNPLRGITTQGLEEKVEQATGRTFYDPQTRAGQIAETVTSVIPGAVTMGGNISRPFKSAIESGVIPAVAGEVVATGFNAAGMPELAEGARVATEIVAGGTSGLKKPKDRAPSYDRIKRDAAQGFINVERAGVQINQNGLNRLLQGIRSGAMKRLTNIPEIDRNLSPDTIKVLDGVEAMAKQGTVPLTTVHRLREMINSELNRGDIRDADAKVLRGTKRQIDEFFDTLGRSDTVGGGWGTGKVLRKAIRDYAKQMRVEEIDRRVSRAELRINPKSGYTREDALRAEFREMAKDEDTMAAFSPRERKAIIDISQGGAIAQKLSGLAPSNSVGNAIRLAFASTVAGGGGFTAGGTAGGLTAGGAVLGIGGAGELGRLAGRAITERNLARTGQMVRGGAGYSVPGGPLMAPLSMYYATTAANTPNSRDAVTQALTPSEIYSPTVDSAYQSVIDALSDPSALDIGTTFRQGSGGGRVPIR